MLRRFAHSHTLSHTHTRTHAHTHTHTYTHTQARTHTHTHTLFDACSRQLLTERMKQRQVRCDPPFTPHITSSHHPAVLTLRVDVPLCFLCFMQLLLPTYSLLGPPALRSVQNTVLCFFLVVCCICVERCVCLSVCVCAGVCVCSFMLFFLRAAVPVCRGGTSHLLPFPSLPIPSHPQRQLELYRHMGSDALQRLAAPATSSPNRVC